MVAMQHHSVFVKRGDSSYLKNRELNSEKAFNEQQRKNLFYHRELVITPTQ